MDRTEWIAHLTAHSDRLQLPLGDDLIAYIVDHRPVGHFLTAVLENDLREACHRADDVNRHRLYDYVVFLYNYAPSGCWGRAGITREWYDGRTR